MVQPIETKITLSLLMHQEGVVCCIKVTASDNLTFIVYSYLKSWLVNVRTLRISINKDFLTLDTE